MSLTSINICNYRSLDDVTLDLCPLDDGSASFGLIGPNEAGKSSVLKAIALVHDSSSITAKEFHDKNSYVGINFQYELQPKRYGEVLDCLKQGHPTVADTAFDGRRAMLSLEIEQKTFARSHFVGLHLPGSDDQQFFRVSSFPPGILHAPIFWAASDKYLISRPIDLAAFAADPAGTSVPLRNCFLLAGIPDVKDRIASLDDSTEIGHLAEELGRCVSKHIRAVWPNHPVEIMFLINANQIHFHVKDDGAAGRAKTADQRSDGFKQFVSFLLTVSAQNANEELARSILLLDEPETHLHPLAQEHLLSELIKLTANKRENIVLFATHSNYMIDKVDLSRNIRVSKEGEVTELEGLVRKNSTYSSVSYEVFSVLSSDYHNELYSLLHERFQDEDPAEQKRSWLKHFDEMYFHKVLGLKKNRPWKGVANEVTLPTYIRNCIHHPENGDKFSQTQLKDAIEAMKRHL